VLQREADYRVDAGSEGGSLHEDQGLGLRADPPEWDEQDEDRVNVCGQPDDLVSRRAVRELQRPAVRRAPHCLHHVSEVVPVRQEVVVAPDREGADPGRPGSRGGCDHRMPHDAERR